MPGGNDRHSRGPTQHRSSDNRDRSRGAGRASAREHVHSSSSSQRASLSDQLLSAAQQQMGHSSGDSGSSSHSSLADQLLEAALDQGQSGHAGSSHHSSSGFGRPEGSFSPQASTPASGGARGGSRLGLLFPAILAFVFIAVMGGFGGGCMSNFEDALDGESAGWNSSAGYSGASGASNTYAISPSLGEGDANETWTVLMYLCGSNLESDSTRLGGGLATSNLVELCQADLGTNVNFVIETGGAKRWQNDVVSSRYLERYAMEDGYMTQKGRVASASMAESSTLEDFLTWGTKSYPADHYLLVFWDHGGGSITGVCNDDLYPYTSDGESDSLTLPEIRKALESCGTRFDAVGFDTCLMATLETAEMLAPYSRYMVASEESEPGSGWDYEAWPSWLAEHPGTSGADLGAVICQTYYNKCANAGTASTATLSTIDLSKIAAVSKAFEDASDDIALATVDSSSLRELCQGAGRSESYGNDGMFSPSMNMVDLADLMSKTREVVGTDADEVVNAVADAVVFEAHGRSRGRASGLSVFYPLQTSDEDDFYQYAEISDNTPYLQFLGVMYGVYDKYDWTKFDNYVSLHGEPVNENRIDIDFNQSVNNDGHVQLQITQGLDQVAQVEIEFYVYLEELDLLCFVGSDNDLIGSYKTGEFTDNFQNDWLAIDGNFVSASLAEQGNGYNIYLVPVYLNGDRTNLLVEYDFAISQFSVVCAWDENDAETGMAGQTGRLLEEGDEVQFLFPALSLSTNEESVIELGTMKWHDDPTVAYEYLGDGTFAFRYAITDVLGNEQVSDFVYESFVDGKYVG